MLAIEREKASIEATDVADRCLSLRQGTCPPYVSLASPKRWEIECGGGHSWRLWRAGFFRLGTRAHIANFRRPMSFEEMGRFAMHLRDLGIGFRAGDGLAPSAVIQDLRDVGMFEGTFNEIERSGDAWNTRQL